MAIPSQIPRKKHGDSTMAPATLGATRIDGGRSLYDSLGLCLKDEFQPRICEPAVFGPPKR